MGVNNKKITADGITLSNHMRYSESGRKIPTRPKSENLVRYGGRYNDLFSWCCDCWCDRFCIVHKLGAKACTIREEVLEGRVR